MPQALFMFIGVQEKLAADARQQFSLTMAAIGSVFSKDGKKIAKRIFKSLEIGGEQTKEDLFDSMSEAQIKMLYGAKALDEWRERQKER